MSFSCLRGGLDSVGAPWCAQRRKQKQRATKTTKKTPNETHIKLAPPPPQVKLLQKHLRFLVNQLRRGAIIPREHTNLIRTHLRTWYGPLVVVFVCLCCVCVCLFLPSFGAYIFLQQSKNKYWYTLTIVINRPKIADTLVCTCTRNRALAHLYRSQINVVDVARAIGMLVSCYLHEHRKIQEVWFYLTTVILAYEVCLYEVSFCFTSIKSRTKLCVCVFQLKTAGMSKCVYLRIYI